MAEWDQRQLCPDGACVGVIGPDGTCKVCGRAAPGWGDERQRGLLPPSRDDDGEDDLDDGEDCDEADDELDEAAADPVAPGTPVAIGAWSARELCSDGACTGVIGANGRCKVCGKPGERGVAPGSSEEAELAAAAADLAASASPDAIADLTETSDDEHERTLCPDGACVGVIGDDGRCNVCGKEAA